MEQTAVEWLAEQMMHPSIHNPYIEQAKEMEKQQITNAWNSAYGGDSNHEGEQYYNETFKQQEQIKTAKELIGKHVRAIGIYGVWKGKEVFGILSEDKGDWIVNIIDEDGFEMPCSVFSPTIKES
jgi:hypothetical protein